MSEVHHNEGGPVHGGEITIVGGSGGNLVDMDVLQEARDLIAGPRKAHYGPPEVNLTRIAALWSAYLDIGITAHDVCSLMILLKQARGRVGYNRDNSVDTAGYAGLQEVLDNRRKEGVYPGSAHGCD